MTRMTQFGFATLLLCAVPAWSQEGQSDDPVVVVPADVPLDTAAVDSPIVGAPVFRPLMDEPTNLGNEPRSMIEAAPEMMEIAPEIMDSASDMPVVPHSMIEASPAPPPSLPPYDEIQQFHYGRCYLSELGTSTNSCSMYGPCHSPKCRYCSPTPKGRIARIKAYMQRTHWGYCNYFDERPLGESLYAAMSQQINRGLEDSMMLYHYDFYPQGSQREGELTPRGRAQLMKIIDRMQDHPAAIHVQIAEGEPKLNQSRRQNVVDSLIMMGANVPDQFVMLAPVRHSGSAIEGALIYENQLQSVISRGRVIQVIGSARFGGR